MSQMKQVRQGIKLSQTWDKYMQLELEEEVTLEQNEVFVVNHPNNFKQTLTFVQTMLTDQPDKQITLTSKGQAMMKAIKIAEILKRKIPELHQVNRIVSKLEKKHFVPLEEGLDEIILENDTVYLVIKLFVDTNEDFESEPGYQAPLDLEEVQENEKSSVVQPTSRNTSFNQSSFNSKNFIQNKKQKNSQPKGPQGQGINTNPMYYPPFNNQMQADPAQQQMMMNPKLFSQHQMMLGNNQIQNQGFDSNNFQNGQQFQQQFGQFMPGIMNPQQMGINRASEFNLDQSDNSDDEEDGYESDSEQEDSQKNMFNQFGQKNQMIPQNMNFQNQMKLNMQKKGQKNFNNQTGMQNPNMINQMMMQQNQKGFRQINMQNAMGQQYQNRGQNKRQNPNNFQQYQNQSYKQQNNSRNNNNRGKNNNNNNKRGKNRNNRGKNNNNRQGMNHQNSNNSYKNSQSFQSNNNSFANQNSQQSFRNHPNNPHHQNSLNSQSSKNLHQIKQNQMTHSQQQLNMTKQNQPFNIQQQNMTQQQIMQMLAQQQQFQQMNSKQKPLFQQFQQQGNPMYQQMPPNPFLQKNQASSDQDDDSSDDQTSSEEETEAKKKPNMLKQRIMMKNEKNQLAKKNTLDQNKNQNLQVNQIGQNLFAQPAPPNPQAQNQINQMMQRNMSLKNTIQPSQSLPLSNTIPQNQNNIQGMQNMNNPMQNQQHKNQVDAGNDSEESESDDKTENDGDSEEEDDVQNPQFQQKQFQSPNQAAMNYFMRMNQQKAPLNTNQNFQPQFPPYMQAQNFEEIQRKMMLQNNQFQMFPNMKANLNEDDDSEESEESEEQSDN